MTYLEKLARAYTPEMIEALRRKMQESRRALGGAGGLIGGGLMARDAGTNFGEGNYISGLANAGTGGMFALQGAGALAGSPTLAGVGSSVGVLPAIWGVDAARGADALINGQGDQYMQGNAQTLDNMGNGVLGGALRTGYGVLNPLSFLSGVAQKGINAYESYNNDNAQAESTDMQTRMMQRSMDSFNAAKANGTLPADAKVKDYIAGKYRPGAQPAPAAPVAPLPAGNAPMPENIVTSGGNSRLTTTPYAPTPNNLGGYVKQPQPQPQQATPATAPKPAQPQMRATPPTLRPGAPVQPTTGNQYGTVAGKPLPPIPPSVTNVDGPALAAQARAMAGQNAQKPQITDHMRDRFQKATGTAYNPQSAQDRFNMQSMMEGNGTASTKQYRQLGAPAPHAGPMVAKAVPVHPEQVPGYVAPRPDSAPVVMPKHGSVKLAYHRSTGVFDSEGNEFVNPEDIKHLGKIAGCDISYDEYKSLPADPEGKKSIYTFIESVA